MTAKTAFICSECGYKSTKWLGKCPECGSWNGFVEEEVSSAKKGGGYTIAGKASVQSIDSIPLAETDRTFSSIGEFDRVLGGMVKGQAILLSGEPGIGKSTLILSIAKTQAQSNKRILYQNGEESNAQIKIRAERLGVKSPNLFLLPDNNLENILEALKTEKPDIVFIDSIQTLYSREYSSLAGSLVQVRETVFALVQYCKANHITLFMVGHITKSGSIAGPKVVEHIVDTVLFLDIDNRAYYRILRSLKNRFYSTDEVGFFLMEESGMKEISDIDNAFIHRHDKRVSGISLYPMVEGNRVFPVEVQSLCVASQFNYPKRTADGLDNNRLMMLVAIAEKRLKIDFSKTDIYLNITNGLSIDDPALDLAVIISLYSAYREKPSPLNTMVFGEVGLTGEVRSVAKTEKRLYEIGRLGFERAVFAYDKKQNKMTLSFQCLPIQSLDEGILALFG